MGPAIEKRSVPVSIIDHYRGKLPDRLLAYWKEYGWCGYANGLFWTVNPQEYEPVLDAWIGDTPFMENDAYHIIARSAFRKLYLWRKTTGNSLNIFAPGSYCIPHSDKVAKKDMNFAPQLFGELDRTSNDFQGMFALGLIPDMVAGGKDVILDFGSRNVNSRIGTQWKKHGRLEQLDKAASAVLHRFERRPK